jgi:methylglutamate dehydrogenase subunit D
MSRPSLAPRSGLEHLLAADRDRTRDAHAGVTLALRRGPALATVSARRNEVPTVVARVRDVFGLQPAHVPRRVIAGSTAFVWAGPGQWLALSEGATGAEFERRLRAALHGLASISDQSDGRTIVSVGGARARDALAKGVPIDLHPRAFRPGDAAVTTIANIEAHLWQVDDKPTYEFIVPRSFAAAFWEWLIDAAAEFGVAIVDESGQLMA